MYTREVGAGVGSLRLRLQMSLDVNNRWDLAFGNCCPYGEHRDEYLPDYYFRTLALVPNI